VRLLTNYYFQIVRGAHLSPPLPLFEPRQAVGLVGILVSRSRELEIAVGTVPGFDDRLNRLLRTLNLRRALPSIPSFALRLTPRLYLVDLLSLTRR